MPGQWRERLDLPVLWGVASIHDRWPPARSMNQRGMDVIEFRFESQDGAVL